MSWPSSASNGSNAVDSAALCTRDHALPAVLSEKNRSRAEIYAACSVSPRSGATQAARVATKRRVAFISSRMCNRRATRKCARAGLDLLRATRHGDSRPQRERPLYRRAGGEEEERGARGEAGDGGAGQVPRRDPREPQKQENTTRLRR